MTVFKGNTVQEHIDELSSAEDFFTYFLLPFEQEILNVSRLHIMKRMGQYLANADFDGQSDDDVFLQTRLQLKKAYQDFVDSSPLEEKVFKVFSDRAAAAASRFVAIDQIAIAAE